MAKVKKIIKTIKIDVDKCNGCRACEVICSAFHANPKYSSNNPARSRIRMVRDPIRDVYLPVYAGEYTKAECTGRDKYVLDGKEYTECDFCRASCPSRDFFKEPDSGLPIKCDMCEDNKPGKSRFACRPESGSLKKSREGQDARQKSHSVYCSVQHIFIPAGAFGFGIFPGVNRKVHISYWIADHTDARPRGIVVLYFGLA